MSLLPRDADGSINWTETLFGGSVAAGPTLGLYDWAKSTVAEVEQKVREEVHKEAEKGATEGATKAAQPVLIAAGVVLALSLVILASRKR